MTRVVLLDSDYLISVFDRSQNKEVDLKRREEVRKMLSDEKTSLRITPLIFYEALRGCSDHAAMDEALMDEDFAYLEVKEAHGRRAAQAFRFAVTQGGGKKPDWLDKRRFDLFHCVCEEVNDVELISDDEHIPSLRQLLTNSKQP
jgi:hypothetical protein